jgi:hypothetical protein
MKSCKVYGCAKVLFVLTMAMRVLPTTLLKICFKISTSKVATSLDIQSLEILVLIFESFISHTYHILCKLQSLVNCIFFGNCVKISKSSCLKPRATETLVQLSGICYIYRGAYRCVHVPWMICRRWRLQSSQHWPSHSMCFLLHS